MLLLKQDVIQQDQLVIRAHGAIGGGGDSEEVEAWQEQPAHENSCKRFSVSEAV